MVAVSHRYRGFTLIELLVVVAIIALLIAILVAALGGARASANKTVCGTRIKGLLTATHEYLTEWNSFPVNGLDFPKAGVPTMYASNPNFAGTEDTNMQDWQPSIGALWGYMASKAPAYMCPSDDGQRTSAAATAGNQALTMDQSGTVRTGPNSGGYWSYSVNMACNSLGRFRNNFNGSLPWGDPLKGTNIQSASNFLVFIEEDAASNFNDEVLDPPAMGGGNLLSNRHNKLGSVGFFDGHVEALKAADFNLITGSTLATLKQNRFSQMFFPDGAQDLP